jgi:5-oxoprolinase (ATP-hydrolysing) subunit C
MTLRVLDPGLLTLVVDLGRPHSRSLGVPLGGAADRTSLVIGNGLVGNPPDAAALEINQAGPRLRAGCRLACVVQGAAFSLAGDRQELVIGKTFTLQPDEELTIGSADRGLRAYLCVRGGIQAASVLGSRSGLYPVRAGDELPCLEGAIQARFIRHPWSWAGDPRLLRVLPGIQEAWFSADVFYSGHFTVSPDSNRMGLRLQGPPLPPPGRELVSEPVCPGSVQVTREGQCIILGVDGQTIGGYPKIAQVISADLDKLGQLGPGDDVRFTPVTLAEAEAFFRKKQAEVHAWSLRLRTAEVFKSYD